MTEGCPLAAGVIGVGAMGTHHARVYNELPETDLVGVADVDRDAAVAAARTYGTEVMDSGTLLERADVASITVPTRHHYDVATAAIDRGTHVLVEKPFVDDPAAGRDLIRRASEADVVLQVGHVERFNPVVDVLSDLLPELDIIAVSARRLGPPVDRDVEDDVVQDLMIHDLDVVMALLERDLKAVTAMTANDERHVTAQVQFTGDVVATLTASRVTQEKIRDLAITARDCRIDVDYMDQSVQIHRHSAPEYRERDGDLRFHHESVIEQPAVESGEPLKRELRSFARAVSEDAKPVVTGADGLRAVTVAREIGEVAQSKDLSRTGVNADGVRTV